MLDQYNKNYKYNDILIPIKSNLSFYEEFLITIKEYFTNNIIFFILCVISRLIPIISFSCDYSSIFAHSNNSKIFINILKKLTLYHFFDNFHISYKEYIIINLLIYFSFFIRFVIYYKLINKMKNFKSTNKWPLTNKFRIISDHIVFLLFPYILEFISFSYYIFFFPNKFIININNKDRTFFFAIMAINTFLIICYNQINYMHIFCSNKIFTMTIFETYSKSKDGKNAKNKHIISFKCSNFIFYIFIFIQNIHLIFPIENYINENKYKIIFKAVLNIILLLIILIIFLNRMYDYKYTNFINTLIYMLLLFSFYSIIFDFIIFISKYKINNKLVEIIYLLIKLFISYITYSLYILKTKKYLQLKIIDILFQDKISRKEDYLINSFYYLNEIMLRIKEDNDKISAYLLIDFFSSHINNCFKAECKCKLLENLLKESMFNKKDIKNLQKCIKKILNILNYFFESTFIEYDFCDKYELAILLSEHYCHLKNNSIMSFSIINTLIQKHKNKLTKYEMVVLYELSRKYIYYILANIKRKIDYEIYNNKKELLIKKQREEYFRNYFYNLKISYKAKKLMFNYINNLIEILKYKNIFEESIIFQLDENNENIISVKFDFFNRISDENNNKLNDNNKAYLYNIINLLKNEKIYYENINFSIDKFEIIKDMPIFIIFKFYLFYDIIEGGNIPKDISIKLGSLIKDKINLNKNYITKDEYAILKRIYSIQNNENNSKYFSIFEFKKEVRTKYFNEACALKLGYKQKDIINKKIESLMPREFYESHQNMIKHALIGGQSKYFSHYNVFFDSSLTILYPIKFESSVIFNISKYLEIIAESTFIKENGYKFMLNYNLELMAHSKNFEEDYYLNKKILKMHDIKIIDIFKISSRKLQKRFQNTYTKINYQNIMKQFKTEEYIIPQLYSTLRQNTGKMSSNNFQIYKNNILYNILNNNNENENPYETIFVEQNDEKKRFVNNEEKIKLIDNLFINPIQIIFHDK